MSGRLSTTTKNDETTEEEPTTRDETFFNLTCNITANTNYLVNGLRDGFTQQIEKNSPALGRNARYTNTSAISRAPAYLTVHLNRFFWRPDIRSKLCDEQTSCERSYLTGLSTEKTKVMRKVKFPFELDATEIFSDELKAKVQPANRKLMEVEKDRAERAKVAKRTRVDKNEEDTGPDEAEKKQRAQEAQQIEDLVDPSLKSDAGASTTGLYELVGIVTHKGASADGGHYIGWGKNTNEEDSWFSKHIPVICHYCIRLTRPACQQNMMMPKSRLSSRMLSQRWMAEVKGPLRTSYSIAPSSFDELLRPLTCYPKRAVSLDDPAAARVLSNPMAFEM